MSSLGLIILLLLLTLLVHDPGPRVIRGMNRMEIRIKMLLSCAHRQQHGFLNSDPVTMVHHAVLVLLGFC